MPSLTAGLTVAVAGLLALPVLAVAGLAGDPTCTATTTPVATSATSSAGDTTAGRTGNEATSPASSAHTDVAVGVDGLPNLLSCLDSGGGDGRSGDGRA